MSVFGYFVVRNSCGMLVVPLLLVRDEMVDTCVVGSIQGRSVFLTYIPLLSVRGEMIDMCVGSIMCVFGTAEFGYEGLFHKQFLQNLRDPRSRSRFQSA